MQISADTKKVIDFLDSVADGGLKKSKDLAVILEIGAAYGLDNLANSLIFTGSSIKKLISLIDKSKPEADGIEKIRNELASESENFINQLSEFMNYADNITKNNFENNFFNSGKESFDNLLRLAEDLSELKIIQTTVKTNIR